MMCDVSVNKQVHVRRQTNSTLAVPENHVLQRICWVNSIQCDENSIIRSEECMMRTRACMRAFSLSIRSTHNYILASTH